MTEHDSTHLVVFKGGTAFNSLLESFRSHFPKTSYVVPVSDDGGSSREICRVFGGPSIGDLRSTLTRLSDDSTQESQKVKKLLEYRLCACDEKQANEEWYQLLEDRHEIYDPISSPYRGLLRCFLCKFEAERLQRIACRFDLRNGSIGNFFFTGARLVLGALETAIFVYSSLARIAHETRVMPIIDTMDRLTIAATLNNGDEIVGQDAISHPSLGGRSVNKEIWSALPAPIVQLSYLNKYGNPFHPKPNRSVTDDLGKCHGIIYGIGSLWTSIIPSLVLEGVGETIAQKSGPKILLLNGCNDRETHALSASEFVEHLVRSLNRYGKLQYAPLDYVTHLIAVEDGSIALDEETIKKQGIILCKVPKDPNRVLTHANQAHAVYADEPLMKTLIRLLN
jgi:2-phospho-L-lactate transferase/gluconeogenesis factor (CofD/UPF0052 family)